MHEPEVALVFTPEVWVEDLHRHLTDHGGGRVRQVVVEPDVALEEQYDVLVVSAQWPALTHGLVVDVHTRGRRILGVYDRTEPAGRDHLAALGADAVVASDSGPQAFVDALATLSATRDDLDPDRPALTVAERSGRIVVVGGAPGSGRTEIAVALAAAVGDVLVDADDVAPAVAARLGLPIEPNIRTAIDAIEHGRADVVASLLPGAVGAAAVLSGLPNPSAWTQVRPGEVIRVVEALATGDRVVVVDGPGALEDVGGPPRGRNAVARALIVEADVIVGVASASPAGVARFLSWCADVRALAPETPMIAVVNRAPATRFRRGEMYAEITRSLPALEVLFLADDRRVGDAAWDGRLANTGPFTRSVRRLGEMVTA
jgi:hypothetical protein